MLLFAVAGQMMAHFEAMPYLVVPPESSMTFFSGMKNAIELSGLTSRPAQGQHCGLIYYRVWITEPRQQGLENVPLPSVFAQVLHSHQPVGWVRICL